MDLPVALLGGTGKLGPGLAMRFARAGVPVLVGSREAEKGVAAAGDINEKLRATLVDFVPVEGMDNAWAATRARVAVITVPFEGQAAMLPGLAESLAGKVVVSTAVPMRFDEVLGPVHVDVAEGSAAQQVAALLPKSSIAAGFHSVSSAELKKLSRSLDEHVVITGDDDDAKRTAMELVRLLPGARPVDGGRLHGARYSEQLTVLLLSVNAIYRTHSGIKLTNLPPDPQSEG
jgi:NADPH-dependent F420 reductase